MNLRTTKEKKRTKHTKGSNACQDGTTQCLIYAIVNQLRGQRISTRTHVFPDPVKDNYRVVQRITHYGKKRSNHCAVDFHISKKIVCNSHSSKCNKNIMDYSNNCSRTKLKISETEP